jgi:type II secretory pathway component PulJ
VRRFAKSCAGSSLLEVLIALSLAAMIALGAVSAQTQALRLMRSALQHRHAAWIADAAAEALRSGMPHEFVRREWDRRSQLALPHGRFDIERQGADVDVLEVSWLVDRSPEGTLCRGGLACIRIAVARQAEPQRGVGRHGAAGARGIR